MRSVIERSPRMRSTGAIKPRRALDARSGSRTPRIFIFLTGTHGRSYSPPDAHGRGGARLPDAGALWRRRGPAGEDARPDLRTHGAPGCGADRRRGAPDAAPPAAARARKDAGARAERRRPL